MLCRRRFWILLRRGVSHDVDRSRVRMERSSNCIAPRKIHQNDYFNTHIDTFDTLLRRSWAMRGDFMPQFLNWGWSLSTTWLQSHADAYADSMRRNMVVGSNQKNVQTAHTLRIRLFFPNLTTNHRQQLLSMICSTCVQYTRAFECV